MNARVYLAIVMNYLYAFDVSHMLDHLGLSIPTQSTVLQNFEHILKREYSTASRLHMDVEIIQLDTYQAPKKKQSTSEGKTFDLSYVLHDLACLQQTREQKEKDPKRYLSALFQCTDMLVEFLDREIKSICDVLYTKRLRWIDVQQLLQHLEDDEYGLYKQDSLKPIQEALVQPIQYIPSIASKQNLKELLEDDHQALLKRGLQFLLTPSRLKRLQHLKVKLFAIWKEVDERQYIAYAFFKHMQDSFRSVEEVIRHSLYRNGLVTMARRYTYSPVASCAHLLFPSITSRLGISEHVNSFIALLTQEIFQAYLSTEQRVTTAGVQALCTLHVLQHPIFIALMLQKLNAQSPTLLHEKLTGYLCLQLQFLPNEPLEQVKSLLSDAQRNLIDLLMTERSPLAQWIQQKAWSYLSVALSQPQQTLIGIHLAAAGNLPFPLTQSHNQIALSLARNHPKRLARLLIQFDLSGWEAVLNEKLIEELQRQELLTPLMMKLSQKIIEIEYDQQRIPATILHRLNQKVLEETHSQSIVKELSDPSWLEPHDSFITFSNQHYILLLKVIRHSMLSKRLQNSKRALLVFLFLLLNFKANASKSNLAFFLAVYRPSRREPERLIKVLRLAYTLLQLDVNPISYLKSDDLTLAQLRHKLTEIGQKSLINRLGLMAEESKDLTSSQDLASSDMDPPSLPLSQVLMQDQTPALSHPLTPIVLTLYSTYLEDQALLNSLKLFYKHILKGQFEHLKYEHTIQQSIIESLCLSHPQLYAWIHKKISWTQENGMVVEECDDAEQVLNASIAPVETCLSWRSGLSCRSLLGFVMDFHQRLVTFTVTRKKEYSTRKSVEVMARCFWRLSTLHLDKEAPMPVLVIEPLYTHDLSEVLYISYLEFAIKKAIELRMPVIEPVRSYADSFTNAKINLLDRYDWYSYHQEWHLSLPGSTTGYELSDTLACFDLTAPARVKVPAYLLFAHNTHARYFKKLPTMHTAMHID